LAFGEPKEVVAQFSQGNVEGRSKQGAELAKKVGGVFFLLRLITNL